MLLRLRVSLPDRPGGLGQFVKALGTFGADILQVTVLEREAGRAVDDFTVSWPGSVTPSEAGERLSAVPGTKVLGVWATREAPGSALDYDLLMHVVAEPARGFATLVDALPGLCGAEWSLVVAQGMHLVVARAQGPVFHRAEVERAVRIVDVVAKLAARRKPPVD
jgi:hypothetical protein